MRQIRAALLCMRLTSHHGAPQVAEELGDAVRIVKIDTEAEPELSSQLQVRTARRCAGASLGAFSDS